MWGFLIRQENASKFKAGKVSWFVFNVPLTSENWPRGDKTFSMLNSVEHEIFPAHKC